MHLHILSIYVYTYLSCHWWEGCRRHRTREPIYINILHWIQFQSCHGLPGKAAGAPSWSEGRKSPAGRGPDLGRWDPIRWGEDDQGRALGAVFFEQKDVGSSRSSWCVLSANMMDILLSMTSDNLCSYIAPSRVAAESAPC